MKRLLIFGALVLAGLGVTTGTAHADPPGETIALDCEGETFQVTVYGNGEFTPAHDLNSTLIGVPIAFGDFTGVFTPAGGGDPETFIEPGGAKANVPRSRNLLIECTFSFTETSPEGTLEVSGSVLLLVPRIKP
jgi:hypothetical protein